MQEVNPTTLQTTLPTRLAYLQSFLHFSPTTDGSLIHATKPILTPLIPTIVDAVYDHLLSYSTTAAPFTRTQTPSLPATTLGEIHKDHANILHRKDFLRGYLHKLANNTDWSPESRFWAYLDGVGKAHTGVTGQKGGLGHRKSKPPLWVEYRDIGLLLGWCEGAVLDIVLAQETLDWETKGKVVRALGKFWWIQNDLFARHYVGEGEAVRVGREMEEDGNGNGNGNGERDEEEKSAAGIWGLLGYRKTGYNL
jgi:hypothetical protein